MQIEVSIPSSLREVKLKDYQKLLIKENPDNDDMLKCILNINTKELGNIKNKDVDNLLAIINKLFDKKHKFIPTFNLNNVLYGFIPNLDEITYGENKDITTYINNKDWGNMHKAMAVLFRPIHKSFKNREKYLISSYEGTEFFSNVMKDMPLGIALGAKVFFYRLGMKLSKDILNSSRLLMEEETLSEEENNLLMKNIDGIKNFTRLQEEMLYGSTKLL